MPGNRNRFRYRRHNKGRRAYTAASRFNIFFMRAVIIDQHEIDIPLRRRFHRTRISDLSPGYYSAMAARCPYCAKPFIRHATPHDSRAQYLTSSTRAFLSYIANALSIFIIDCLSMAYRRASRNITRSPLSALSTEE